MKLQRLKAMTDLSLTPILTKVRSMTPGLKTAKDQKTILHSMNWAKIGYSLTPVDKRLIINIEKYKYKNKHKYKYKHKYK